MDVLFSKHVVSELKKFPKVSVDHADLKKMDESVCEQYGVPNITKLHDIFDARSYYEKYRTRAMSEAAVEKLLGIKFIDWHKKERIRNDKAVLRIDNIVLEIVGVRYGELPIIYNDTGKKIIICIVREKREVTIAGYVDLSDKKIKLLPIKNSPVTGSFKKLGTFQSFDQILPFSSYEELKNIILKK